MCGIFAISPFPTETYLLLCSGTVAITVSFPNYFAAQHLSTVEELTIVKYTETTMELFPYPSYQSGYGDASIMGRLHCSIIYQRATVKVTGHASNGQTRDITNFGNVDIYSTNTNFVSIDKPVLVAERAGKKKINNNLFFSFHLSNGFATKKNYIVLNFVLKKIAIRQKIIKNCLNFPFF